MEKENYFKTGTDERLGNAMNYPTDIKSEPILAMKQEPAEISEINISSVDIAKNTFKAKVEFTEEDNATDSSVSPRMQLQCDICRKQYDTAEELLAHTRDANFECLRRCPTNSNKGEMHRQTMPNDDSIHKLLYECDICRKRFSQNSDLVVHKRNHTDEKSYECDICLQSYSQRRSLTRHKLIHSSEKPHECDVCHKTFIQNSDLTRHKRVHTGEKPFECEVCHKRFSDNNSLVTHKRLHTGEKPYECDICHKIFIQKSNLSKHKRIVHTVLNMI